MRPRIMMESDKRLGNFSYPFFDSDVCFCSLSTFIVPGVLWLRIPKFMIRIRERDANFSVKMSIRVRVCVFV